MYSKFLYLLLFFVLSAQSVFSATQMLSVDERIKRLESLLSSGVLNEQQQQIEVIKNELKNLQDALDLSQSKSAQDKKSNNTITGFANPAPQHIHAKPGSISQYAAPPKRQAPWIDPKKTSVVQVEPVLKPAGEKAQPVEVDYDGYEDYQHAFGALMSGQYKRAINEFSVFIQAYPDSRYIGKSYFWLAEASYLWQDYHAALDGYRQVINNFPKSDKRQLAALKIGLSYYEVKDWHLSKSSLQQVVSVYPNTVVASKAKIKLKIIKSEGH